MTFMKSNTERIAEIQNPIFRKYAEIYHDIDRQFYEQLEKLGLLLVEAAPSEREMTLKHLGQQGAIIDNDGKSVHVNWLSDACRACRTGIGSASFFLSLQCHRHCYYCFNSNQEHYGHYSHQLRDCIGELEQLCRNGRRISHVAMTGGEPLLHPQESIEFFQRARTLFGQVHSRLYTSGDLVDAAILSQLQQAGLSEIRFSIKLEDSLVLRRIVLEKIALAKQYIPSVMVEMPVIPGDPAAMQELLRHLDRLEIAGINLLEFCFPFHNAAEFQRRGFAIKTPPWRVLYDYWYAGGLPVAGSETACLELLEFALTEKLRLGVHYCSLENKHTGQIFQQNSRQPESNLVYLSPRDYFYKTAKVFGADISLALSVLNTQKALPYQRNTEHQYLEFHVRNIELLRDLNLEVGISSQIMEERDGVWFLRELCIEPIFARQFDLQTI